MCVCVYIYLQRFRKEAERFVLTLYTASEQPYVWCYRNHLAEKFITFYFSGKFIFSCIRIIISHLRQIFSFSYSNKNVNIFRDMSVYFE